MLWFMHQSMFRTLKWAICMILTLSVLYAMPYVGFLYRVSRDIYYRDVIIDSAENNRGDIVTISTDFHGAPEHPWRTIIRLKRVDRWFSTTLMEARSYAARVNPKWRSNDTLNLQLDFGCGAHLTPGVEAVGPIHIRYHFADAQGVPKLGGGSSGRSNASGEPCR